MPTLRLGKGYSVSMDYVGAIWIRAYWYWYAAIAGLLGYLHFEGVCGWKWVIEILYSGPACPKMYNTLS